MGTRALGVFVDLKILGYPVKPDSTKLFWIKLYNCKRMRLPLKIFNLGAGFLI